MTTGAQAEPVKIWLPVPRGEFGTGRPPEAGVDLYNWAPSDRSFYREWNAGRWRGYELLGNGICLDRRRKRRRETHIP